jgi:dipeptidyl-peptidase-4
MRGWIVALALASVGSVAMTAEAGAQTGATRPAATPDGGTLTLARVFGSPDLSGSQPRGVRLSPDGTLLTFLRPRADEKERTDLWARDTRTGAERMLVDSKKVGSGAELSEAEKMQRERARIGGSKGIVAYDFSPDGKAILVPLDGDLYLASLDGQVRRLAQTPGGELNPVVSPKGGYVSFVRDQNRSMAERRAR